jgi:hypothetical protein
MTEIRFGSFRVVQQNSGAAASRERLFIASLLHLTAGRSPAVAIEARCLAAFAHHGMRTTK